MAIAITEKRVCTETPESSADTVALQAVTQKMRQLRGEHGQFFLVIRLTWNLLEAHPARKKTRSPGPQKIGTRKWLESGKLQQQLRIGWIAALESEKSLNCLEFTQVDCRTNDPEEGGQCYARAEIVLRFEPNRAAIN